MTDVSQELFSNWLISIIEVVGPRLNSSATLNDRKAGAQTARVDQWHEREEFLVTVAFGGNRDNRFKVSRENPMDLARAT